MKSWEVVQQGTPREGSRALAERTLDAALAFFNGRCAALFERDQERMILFASRGVYQDAIERVTTAWSTRREEIEAGRGLHGALEDAKAGRAFSFVPVLEGVRLLGLMYVESDEDRFAERRDLDVLVQFSRIAAMALAAPSVPGPAPVSLDAYLERTPTDDVVRDQLLILLERNEWNIARVSRLMGVTRPTIYKRLERYGLERRRVRKTRLRQQPA